MNRLRLSIIAPGLSVHTKRWVEALKDRGHEVQLVTLQPSLTDAVEIFNPYQRMGAWRIPKLHHPIAHEMVRRAIDGFGPDIVHMHYLEATPGMIRLSKHWPNFVISVWGSDVVWTSDHPEPRREVARKRRLFASAAEITATTRYLVSSARPFLAADRPVHVIPFGVETDRFQPIGERSPNSATVIGFMKHFAPRYGPDVLIRSMISVHKRCPGARAIMYGDLDIERYRAMVEDLGLSGVVSLRDAIPYESVPRAMSEFDVLAMPSITESFGVAAIEASACAIPVVASRAGGIPEAVLDGRTGLLVPPGDAEALAEALVTLVEDRRLGRRLGEAGRNFVLERFEWSANVTEMERLYDSMLAGQSALGADRHSAA